MSALTATPTRHLILYWFRNDLRLHDNPSLHAALDLSKSFPSSTFLPLYIFDDRFLTQRSRNSKHAKSGAIRANFLRESVRDLRSSLTKLGHPLHILHDRPESAIRDLAGECNRFISGTDISLHHYVHPFRQRSY